MQIRSPLGLQSAAIVHGSPISLPHPAAPTIAPRATSTQQTRRSRMSAGILAAVVTRGNLAGLPPERTGTVGFVSPALPKPSQDGRRIIQRASPSPAASDARQRRA